jgi:LPS-assembly lipoprotein
MRQLTAIVVLTVSLLVSGCSYRPLYGTGSEGKGVAVALSGIGVEEQKTRAGQIVRNNLISSFGNDGSAKFVLRLVPDEKTQQVSSLSSQKLSRQRYRLNVKYELADAQNGEAVATGSSFSNVSYDTVEQPIADLRAAESARERAAREVAEDIRLRLAAHFSSSN